MDATRYQFQTSQYFLWLLRFQLTCASPTPRRCVRPMSRLLTGTNVSTTHLDFRGGGPGCAASSFIPGGTKPSWQDFPSDNPSWNGRPKPLGALADRLPAAIGPTVGTSGLGPSTSTVRTGRPTVWLAISQMRFLVVIGVGSYRQSRQALRIGSSLSARFQLGRTSDEVRRG
jgi:hypothetical protein